MLAIRLSRVGKKKFALFRVVVSEKTKDTVGNYLELLGNYNPHTNEAVLKADRIKYWISKGAQPSGSVHNLLVGQKIIEGEKIKVANIKKKSAEGGSQPKADQPLAGAKTSGGKADKENDAEEKKEEPKEAPKAVPEVKKEEPKKTTEEPKKKEPKDEKKEDTP